MSDRTAVFVHGNDPVSEAGVISQLRVRPDMLVAFSMEEARVAVVVVERMDADAVATVRAISRTGETRVVLVASVVDDAGLLAAVEAGASAVLRRREATADRLAASVRQAADGGGAMPPDLLGRLLGQVGNLQRSVLAPRGIGPQGFTDREVAILRMMADGFDTTDIAGTLCYSERTVKNVLHDVTTRFNLRNRCHAVAYALREGVI